MSTTNNPDKGAGTAGQGGVQQQPANVGTDTDAADPGDMPKDHSMAKPANPGGELPAIGSELGAGLTLEEAVTGKLGTHTQDPSPCPEILNTGADAAQASEQPVDQPASLPPPNSWEKCTQMLTHNPLGPSHVG